MTRDRSSAVVAELVKRGLGSHDSNLRRVAADALADLEPPGVDIELLPALSDPAAATRAAAACACGFVKARSTRDRLVELVDTDPDPLVRSVAAESVGRLGGPDAVALLDRFMQSPREEVQVAALSRYFEIDPVRGAAVTAEVLSRRDLRADLPLRPLLVQAIEEATRYATKPCVPRLVELLAHPRARARDMAWQALREITGLEIPNQATDWMQWWSMHGRDFVSPRAPLPANSAKPIPGGAANASRATSGMRSEAQFYGIPIVSDRVVFVIDHSGSMREPGPDGRSKIDGARAALAQVLNALPDGTEFGIIAFSDEPHVESAPLRKRSSASVAAAMESLSSIRAEGSTNLYDSLVKAIDVDGADTVVLLTDGEPSSGAVRLYPRIKACLQSKNRLRRVAISTIGLGTSPASNRFLRDLARLTGGDFVER